MLYGTFNHVSWDVWGPVAVGEEAMDQRSSRWRSADHVWLAFFGSRVGDAIHMDLST
jgi:hypothetical protein